MFRNLVNILPATLTGLFPLSLIGLLWLLHFSSSAFAITTVSDEMLKGIPGKSWLGFRGNLANWGYSSLNQVNTDNIDDLAMVWSWSLDPGTNETTPVAHDGILYVANPSGVIQALDGETGDLIWEYIRPLPSGVIKSIGAHTRSLSLYKDRVFSVTGDGHIIALNIVNGELEWESKVGEINQISQTTGPVAAAGKVFSGRSCLQSYRGTCFIAAHDAETGEELWRTYVVPKEGEYGDDTWGELDYEERRHVGAWGPGSYDPALNLVYWGTSVPAPSNEFVRGTPGAKMLYTNSTLALDGDTGEIVWYFQHLPRDNWDMDHVFERILVDSRTVAKGDDVLAVSSSIERDSEKQLLTGIPGKTGIVWTLDRATGEFLWAKETLEQDFIESIDPESGEVTVAEEALPKSATDELKNLCPSNKGGKNWPPGAYSPRTNTLYMPLQNTCMDIKPLPTISESGQVQPEDGYGLLFNVYQRPGTNSLGEVHAISVMTGKTHWTYRQRAGVMGVLATGGGLIFVGDTDRRLKALDENTGTVLWETILNAPVTGSPMSFEADGRQYIAVTVGGGDWVSGELNTIAGLPSTAGNNMLYVFAIPSKDNSGSGRRDHSTQEQPILDPLEPSYTSVQLKEGIQVYQQMCLGCHGEDMRGTSNAPALSGEFFQGKWAGKSAAEFFQLTLGTMPLGSAGTLTRDQVTAILAYWYNLHGYRATGEPMVPEAGRLKRLPLKPNH